MGGTGIAVLTSHRMRPPHTLHRRSPESRWPGRWVAFSRSAFAARPPAITVAYLSACWSFAVCQRPSSMMRSSGTSTTIHSSRGLSRVTRRPLSGSFMLRWRFHTRHQESVRRRLRFVLSPAFDELNELHPLHSGPKPPPTGEREAASRSCAGLWLSWSIENKFAPKVEPGAAGGEVTGGIEFRAAG